MAAPLVLIEGFEARSPEVFEGTPGGGLTFVTGRFGGYAAKCYNVTCPLRPLPAGADEISLGFNVYLDAANQAHVIHVRDVAAKYLLRMGVGGASASVNYYTGVSETSQTYAVHVPSQWYNMQLRFKYGASGYVEVRKDGATVATYTGSTIAGGATGGIYEVVFMPSGSSVAYVIDDLWIERGAGADFRAGDRRVISVAPTSDSAAGWAASTGANHWGAVSENPAATSSYVSTPALSGAVDTYGLADLPGGVTVVEAVAVSAIAQRTDSGAAKLAVARGGTAGSPVSLVGTGTAWDRVAEVFATDGSGAAWTPARVNASTAGIVASA